MRAHSCGSLVVSLTVLAAASSTVLANNPYGIMLRHGGGYDSIWVSRHLQEASDLCGEWGYTRTGGGPGNENATKRDLVMHRAKRLIPIVNVSSHDADWEIAGFVQNMKNDGYTIPYLEIGNEPQGEWSAADYAAHLLNVIRAVKAVDPDIQIMNGGFVGAGNEYLDDMFNAVPDLIDELDIVCCHPYAINYPPDDPRGFLGYQDTVAVMDAHGFTGPIAFTEFGWELGNQLNPAFPKITEELRAEYVVDAFENYIETDPRILAACPFILSDQMWNGWSTYEWIRWDGEHTQQYDAVAALTKPAGDDYLPGGSANLQGRVIDPALDQGVPGGFVYLTPGPYAAETDADGYYAINNIPAGSYSAGFFKDGYQPPATVNLVVGSNATLDFVAPRYGVFWHAFDSEGGYCDVADGWTPDTGGCHPDIFEVDAAVKHSGAASQRINANDFGIWRASNYNSVWTGEVWHAEVWIKTEGLSGGPDARGAYLGITFRDNFFSYVDEVEISTGILPDRTWTPLAMTFVVPENGRRMQVHLGCDADEGSVWFDDIIIDRAELPLPQWGPSPPEMSMPGWQLVSLPLRPRDNACTSVFDDMVLAGQSLENRVVGYDAASGYTSYPTDLNRLDPLGGYWLDVADGVAGTQEVIAGQRVVGDATIPLDAGWNLIGYPFISPQPLANCLVRKGASERTFDNAAAEGWLSAKAFYYVPAYGYTIVSSSPPSHGTDLMPWYAYWIRAYESDLSLMIPDPVEVGSLSGTVTDEFNAPVEGAVISCMPGGYWGLTDADGDYTIEGIPAGTYDVQVTGAEALPTTIEAQAIPVDATHLLDIVLVYQEYPTEVQNPGFEWDAGLSGWTRVGEVDGQQSGPWYGSTMPHEGNYFLGTGANWGGKMGGVYQQLSVTPGTSYTASAWYAVYWTGGTAAERGCRIGVDPNGGIDPDSPDIVWSDWGSEPVEGLQPPVWRQISVNGVTANAPRQVMTIFLEHNQRPGGIWNVTCFDDVELNAE